MAKLTDLPFELLLELLIKSGNESLVAANRWTYNSLRPLLTARTCYRFVREKGRWQKGRVIMCSLPYRFFSPDLLEQIRRNESELMPKKNKMERRAMEDVKLNEIKIPSRLFQVVEGAPLPVYWRGRKRKRCVSVNQTRFDLVSGLLKMKLSVRGAKGSTGLVMSARAGNLAMIRLLLKNGTDAAGSDNKALLMAVVYGHLDVAKRLVRAGAPVSSLALRYAVQKRHLEIVAWLMKKGAAPDMLTIKLLDRLG
ncbi:hypothetical protein GGI25_001018 [Coemansia spiralis]|uniref:Ankyrin repeat protein n=2 Tax=Coemansia TaxID=4863 RepID=A0A9W8GBT8_9FUNG|nr:hypothetical protein EDC05_003889 [Coemansia umbellata]KAJ2621626.1 hypothetical protein GGI26_003960 [Coemansia sp. RSA 1358]KAJ2680127.1 hypothetical protein GGI25_001018 [Coemansia spiralis]